MAISRPRYNQRKKRRLGPGKKFKQGFYNPKNPDKFRASQDITMNSGPLPFYRSSWELRVYRWCDESDQVEFWGTESINIKYISPKDNKPHRYFPDVFIKFVDGRKMIVEIKPLAQVNSPINQAKFEAAHLYAEKIGGEFVIMTEKDLNI